MKILIVAMRSIHTIRWVSQLENSGHEIHWFDILNGGRINEWSHVTQHTDWRYKFGDFKGRFFLKKYLPWIHNFVECDVEKEFNKLLKKIQPDVVHSFVLYKCCVPIFPEMQKHPAIKWIYSSWGSDLYYFRNIPKYKKDIQMVLPRIDYLFTDTLRDFKIATDLGFKNKFLGVFPGGGGFHLTKLEPFIRPFASKKNILVKGYQGRSGRAITVLKALLSLNKQLQGHNVIVFGASDEVQNYLKEKEIPDNWIVHSKLSHIEVLKLMGEALIYIGNSASDGMPNTLLEAIIMGAFPIQSNPGGASAEIIEDSKNGLLIDDCEDEVEISEKINFAMSNKELLQSANKINQEIRTSLAYDVIQHKVLEKYNLVARELE